MTKSSKNRDFLEKRISQTEYRGSKYYSFFSKNKQFLDSELPEGLGLEGDDKKKMRNKALKSVQHFLSKILHEEKAESVLRSSFTKSILKKLGIL